MQSQKERGLNLAGSKVGLEARELSSDRLRTGQTVNGDIPGKAVGPDFPTPDSGDAPTLRLRDGERASLISRPGGAKVPQLLKGDIPGHVTFAKLEVPNDLQHQGLSQLEMIISPVAKQMAD